jgi:hypothetical protein
MLFYDDTYHLIVIDDLIGQVGKADEALSHVGIYLSVGSGTGKPYQLVELVVETVWGVRAGEM